MGKVLLAIVLLFVACAWAQDNEECDCECAYLKCKAHAKKHQEVLECEKGLQMCQDCPVTDCNSERDLCLKEAKDHHGNQHKCIDAWYKCASCKCRWQRCEKHSKEHGEKSKCELGLDICRYCDTAECDTIAEKCHSAAKTHDELHKCIDDWHKCGKCMCRFKQCEGETGDKFKCEAALLVCKNCDTKLCDSAIKTCMDTVKTHDDLHLCLEGWHACVDASCTA